MTSTPTAASRAQSRRRLALDALGLSLEVVAFGLVYGLAARHAGLSVADALAMSVFVLAGASQLAAMGMLAHGLPWIAIVGFTALLNARHLLYSAAMAPWLRTRRRAERAAAAHVLVDETFALSFSHFSRLGDTDMGGYWLAAALIVIPWPLSTVAGYLGGAVVPDPQRLGLDVVVPAAFAGLTIGLISGRRELVAAVAGASCAVAVGLAAGAMTGVVAGGLLGPAAALLVPPSPPRPLAGGTDVLPDLADRASGSVA